MNNKRIALIPAYEPDGRLVTLAEELEREGFSVVIVNDGSGAEGADVFREAARWAATSRRCCCSRCCSRWRFSAATG